MFRSSNFSILTLTVSIFLMQLWHHGVTSAANCAQYTGKSCEECVEVSGCSYCEPTKQCEEGSVIEKTVEKTCEGQEWKVKQCVVSGRVLIIALSVTGFLVLVALGCFIYCCCCRRKSGSRKAGKEEAKLRRERAEISQRHKEREAERREKRDEIRKKYGIQQSV